MHKKKEKKRKGRRDKRNCRFTKGALIRFLGADHQSLEAPLPMTFIQLACWFNKQTNPYRLSDQISTLKTLRQFHKQREWFSRTASSLSPHLLCKWAARRENKTFARVLGTELSLAQSGQCCMVTSLSYAGQCFVRSYPESTHKVANQKVGEYKTFCT